MCTIADREREAGLNGAGESKGTKMGRLSIGHHAGKGAMNWHKPATKQSAHTHTEMQLPARVDRATLPDVEKQVRADTADDDSRKSGGERSAPETGRGVRSKF